MELKSFDILIQTHTPTIHLRKLVWRELTIMLYVCQYYHDTCSTPDNNVYETVEEPQPKAEITSDSKQRSKFNDTHTAKQNEHDYCDGSLTPPLPPRTYSLSSSLDKIDNLENIQLQDLSTDQGIKDEEPSENTYQPLILPRHSNTATTGSEYQSLTQFRQHDSERKF